MGGIKVVGLGGGGGGGGGGALAKIILSPWVASIVVIVSFLYRSFSIA